MFREIASKDRKARVALERARILPVERPKKPAPFTHLMPYSHQKFALDSVVPMAYLDPTWKYYSTLVTRGRISHVFFYDTRNGPAFMIDPKTGRRKPVSQRFVHLLPDLRVHARSLVHTWDKYLKRAEKFGRILRGRETGAKAKMNRMTDNIHHDDINKYTLSNLKWWAKHTFWDIDTRGLSRDELLDEIRIRFEENN